MSDIIVKTEIPYEQEIRAMISSGWTVENICRHLNRTRNAEIALEDVQSIKDAMPASLILPTAALQEKFGGLDVIADPLGEMARLLRIQSDRLAVALNLEHVKGSRVPYVDSAVKSYWKLLLEFVELQQSLGIENSPSAKETSPPVPLLGDGIPTLRLILAEREPETINGTVKGRHTVNSRGRAPQLLTR